MTDLPFPDASRPMYYVLNDDHTTRPLHRDEFNLITWGEYYENRMRLAEQGNDPFLVGREYFANGYELSTVFLSLDHDYTFRGPPILFETMLFGGEESEVLARYATWQLAEEGHRRYVIEYSALADVLDGIDLDQ